MSALRPMLLTITLATSNDPVAAPPPPRSTEPDDPTAVRLAVADISSQGTFGQTGGIANPGTGPPNLSRPIAARSGAPGYSAPTATVLEAAAKSGPYPRGQQGAESHAARECQPRPSASSRSTRRGGAALASQ